VRKNQKVAVRERKADFEGRPDKLGSLMLSET
jgi:hypothetical protein